MINQKRGLSTVVTTLIIILLVLVAIGIIWVVIRNVVEQGTQDVELSVKCLDLSIKATAVVNTTNDGDYSVTLKRTGGGEEISGVKMVIHSVTDSSEVKTHVGNIEPLATTTASLETASDTTPILNANKIEVTPYILDASGNEQYCSTSEFSFVN